MVVEVVGVVVDVADVDVHERCLCVCICVVGCAHECCICVCICLLYLGCCVHSRCQEYC